MYRHILVPVDIEWQTERRPGLEAAARLSQCFGAQLHVLTVVPDMGMPLVGQFFPKGAEEAIVEEAKAALHELVEKKVPEGIPVQCVVAQGSIYRRILEMAETVGADLIVMAAHHPEGTELLLGPNASRVARHAPCSVLVVRV
ncbi:MAG: universal stress protein [Deferrisomatales bacterium]|nr:universal stress protein [Deferrisomatales bacterium]